MTGTVCFAFVLAVSCSSLSAEPPCADLTPFGDEDLGYQKRGDRCEGLYQRSVSGPKPRISLLSLTRGELRFSWSRETELQISAKAPQGKQLQVRAQPLPADVPYQMDAFLGPGTSLQWPVADVLFSQGLTASRLGVLAWLRDEEPEVFVPVHLAEVGQADASADLVAILRSNVRIDYLHWRAHLLENGRCTKPGDWVWPEKKDRDPLEEIEIRLPPGRARMCLEVLATEKGGSGQRLTKTIRIIHETG